jgi:hypothetical protein
LKHNQAIHQSPREAQVLDKLGKKKVTAERKGTQLATWLSKGSKDEIPAQERMFTTRNTAPDTNSKLRRRKRMVSQCSPLRQVFVTTSDKLSPQSEQLVSTASMNCDFWRKRAHASKL